MSFLASLGLGGQKQASTPAPATDNNQQSANQQQPGNQQQQQPGGNPNDKTAGSNVPVDPLAAYSKMYDNSTNQQKEGPPSLTLDPEVVTKVAGQINFMEGVPQDLVQKATNGDVQALMQMMSHVGQQAYRHSLQHNGVLVDKFVGAREAHFAKDLPGRVREELTLNNLAGPNGVSSPTAKKHLAEIAKRIAANNPDASPQEVAESAKQYIADMYKATHAEQSGSGQKQQEAGEFDWDKWANSQ